MAARDSSKALSTLTLNALKPGQGRENDFLEGALTKAGLLSEKR